MIFKRIIRRLLSILIKRILGILLATKAGREFLFRAYPANMLLIANNPHESYVVNTSDLEIGLKTFVSREAFSSDMFRDVFSLLPKEHSKNTIVDIGANIGTISIYAIANNFFKTAIAFEPEPQNFRLLKTNVALNNLENFFILHNIALSDTSGDTLQFELCVENQGDHRVRVAQKDGLFRENERNVISVKSDILDNYSQEFEKNSTLIWIDTQGYEGLIFSGADSIISKQIPICMEFWPYGLKRADGYDRLLEIFSNSQYQKIVDLRRPDIELKLNRENLEKIARELGFDGKHTDLLIL